MIFTLQMGDWRYWSIQITRNLYLRNDESGKWAMKRWVESPYKWECVPSSAEKCGFILQEIKPKWENDGIKPCP